MISPLSSFVKKIKIGDLMVVITIAALCAGSFFLFCTSDHKSMATISLDGKILYCVDLSDPVNEEKEFTVSGTKTNIIRVEHGKIFVKEADCPDQTCVLSGKLSDSGVICCLPNKMLISVQSDASDVDVIAR